MGETRETVDQRKKRIREHNLRNAKRKKQGDLIDLNPETGKWDYFTEEERQVPGGWKSMKYKPEYMRKKRKAKKILRGRAVVPFKEAGIVLGKEKKKNYEKKKAERKLKDQRLIEELKLRKKKAR